VQALKTVFVASALQSRNNGRICRTFVSTGKHSDLWSQISELG